MTQDTIRGWSFILQTLHQNIIKDFGINIKPANILISDLGDKTLGLWNETSRTIEISKHLISSYSWDEVVHTFKHEMAHQIVSEIYAKTERPHGDYFKKACVLLGISSEATVHKDSLAKTGLQKKISKLLALSTSSNENEAQAALTKAHELSCKHNLSLIDHEQAQFNLLPVGSIRKKIPRYEHTVIAILNEFYFVKALQNYRLDENAQSVGWQFELYGDLENLTTAEYVYYFLINQGHDLWINYKRENGAAVSRKKHFYLSGLYEGFYKKLKSEREDILNKFALTKIHDVKLDDFFSDLNPSVRRRTVRHSVDPKIYQDGISEGQKLNIRHGLGASKSSDAIRLLEG